MSHTQIFQIAQTGRMDPVVAERCIFTGKRPVFSPVFFRKTAGFIPGKFFYMKFVDNPFRPFSGRPVFLPSFRICTSQVYRHTASAINSAGPCPGISGTYLFPFNFQHVIVIDPVHIFSCMPAPYTFFLFFHRNTGNSFPSVSL